MAQEEEMSALFPVFALSIVALLAIPWTLYRLIGFFSSKKQTLHCPCSQCDRDPKNRPTVWARVSKFLSIQNVSLILMWVAMVALLYYIKVLNRDAQPFEPFSILGLSPGASDADIKKAYRKLSLQYHPDKNPDPAAHKFFVDYISKAYQALTDEVARANWEKYGHPDGQQAMNVGIALPKFMLDIQGPKGAYLLLGLVGVGILLPLIAVVIYLSRSSKYTGNNVIQDTLRNFYQLMKPSLAPRLITALQFLETKVDLECMSHGSDEGEEVLYGMCGMGHSRAFTARLLPLSTSLLLCDLTRSLPLFSHSLYAWSFTASKVIDAPTKAMEFLEMRVRGPDVEPMQRVSSLVCSELNLAWTGPPSPSPSPVHPAMGAPHHSNVIDVLTNAMEFLEMKVHGLDVESPCSSKVIDVLTKAMEFLEMKVRGSDVEPMQKVFSLVRHELNLDPKNLKQETKKFWTRFPALIKVELLLLAQLTRQADLVPPELRKDFNTILKLTPRLMEELIKISLYPRPPVGYAWLRPAVGAIELSQSFYQAVPLSARKQTDKGGSAEGIAALLQLPHVDEGVVKKLTRKEGIAALLQLPHVDEEVVKKLMSKVRSGVGSMECLTAAEASDVETTRSTMPEMVVNIPFPSPSFFSPRHAPEAEEFPGAQGNDRGGPHRPAHHRGRTQHIRSERRGGAGPHCLSFFLLSPPLVQQQKLKNLQELRELSEEARTDLLTTVGGLSPAEASDVEATLSTMPEMLVDAACITQGADDGIQEGDVVTLRIWLTLRRGNGHVVSHPHMPHFPYRKDEAFWLMLADQAGNSVWLSQRVTFLDETAAIRAAADYTRETVEAEGFDDAEVAREVKEAVERVKGGARLVIGKFQAPAEGVYALTVMVMSDVWIGCDKKVPLKIKVRVFSKPLNLTMGWDGVALLVIGKFQSPAEGVYGLIVMVMSDVWIGCDKKVPLKIKVRVFSKPLNLTMGWDGVALLVIGKFQSPAEGVYALTVMVMSDVWIGCDKNVPLKIKVGKRTRAGTRGAVVPSEGAGESDEEGEEEEGEGEEEEGYDEDDDYMSEYSEDEEEEGEGEGKKGGKEGDKTEGSDGSGEEDESEPLIDGKKK
ncbi:unnamed protein product [Closterium sp. NIES-64]|nr:unnamed protein product [Closterium sp. NIES-64]